MSEIKDVVRLNGRKTTVSEAGRVAALPASRVQEVVGEIGL